MRQSPGPGAHGHAGAVCYKQAGCLSKFNITLHIFKMSSTSQGFHSGPISSRSSKPIWFQKVMGGSETLGVFAGSISFLGGRS